MKKQLTLLFLVLLPILYVQAQCEGGMTTNCIDRLTPKFKYLQSYKVERKTGKEYVEYSYAFSKGMEYFINFCPADRKTNGVTVSLFDYSRNQVASTKVDGEKILAIAYPCNTTGIYYIRYTFDGNACGSSALAFKRSL